eukprot:TRINITY_DN20397_c0_g1_i1.p1 TRINITY_DN20397_c0_g1~~TRINITY_DN20397_c0_g1_i1.p1  ORF type:complete len:459 (-),score=104.22 TRINITY_DN20397_c0_g1_i1:23-1399(-)
MAAENIVAENIAIEEALQLDRISIRPPPVADVKRYAIDLDSPVKERWFHIIEEFKDQFVSVSEQIDKIFSEDLALSPFIEKLISGFMAGVTHMGVVYYGKELKGISKYTGISLGKLVLMQLVYEASACCTSIVTTSSGGVPVHIRTMDWDFKFLGPLTVELDFYRGGERLYSATSWVGYVGILTGMRPNGYSVSVNFRNTSSSYLQNLKQAIVRGWPIGFLVRACFEIKQTYEAAVEALANSHVIAPCYFTICGTHNSQTIGTLLTRRRTSEEQRLTVRENGPIIQTNIDHWSNNPEEDILWSIARRALATRLLSSIPEINEQSLWELVNRHPIRNEETIYATFMCPEIGILHTRTPKEREGFLRQDIPEFMPFAEIRATNHVHTRTCVVCREEYTTHSNFGGLCAHVGNWHSTISDCSPIVCGFKLGRNIGMQHWSCCYNTDGNSRMCKKSPAYVPV